MGLCYKCLHCGLLTTFESVYEQFTSVSKAADSEVSTCIWPTTIIRVMILFLQKVQVHVHVYCM